MEEQKTKMVNELEDTITYVCKLIKQESIICEKYPQTVAALAELVMARAALR